MGIKVSKDKNISRWVGQENLVYSRWNRIKSHVQTWRRWSLEEKEVRQSEVKPVKNITKNLHSFLEISIVQIKVLASHKLWDNADK